MRHGFLRLLCAGGLVLQAAAAQAESWSVVEGRVSINGKKKPLSGAFTGSVFEPDPPDGDTPVVLSLEDFAFSAGRRELTPRIPVEYDGLLPVAWLQIADGIHLDGEQVDFLHVRTGGKLVAESDDEVTFRFLELRADASHGGYVQGRLGDTDLPRRLVLKGDVYEVRQSFGLPGESCGQPPGGGGTGGGVIGSSGAILSYESFDIGAQEEVQFVRPAGAGAVLNRVHGSSSLIAGELHSNGSVYLLNPVGVDFESTPVAAPASALVTAPTLEELGIRAPEGAEVQLDADGAVRVVSAGDLFVDGTRLAAASAELASLTVSTSGSVVIAGDLHAPASLRLEAGGQLRIDSPDGEIVPAEGSVVVSSGTAIVGFPNYCQGLRPFFPPDERQVGRFSLVASAARQIKIDVRLEPMQKRIIPGSDQVLRTVVFGSRSLDVHDIDRDGRLLGRGEAETIHPGLRRFTAVNGDRYRDLLTDFLVRDAEVAYGDREICLVARTLGGELLEGCDEIHTGSIPAPR